MARKRKKKKGTMYIVNAIPITRGIGKEELSYFSSKKYTAGSVVNVPLRKKNIAALVTSIEDVKRNKSALRTADFSLKKIRPQNESRIFLPSFLETVKESSDYFASTTGSLLDTLVPKAVLKRHEEMSLEMRGKTKKTLGDEVMIMQASLQERHLQFKSIVREEFARDKSVFFLVPTIQDAERIEETIKKGIGEYIYILHSSLTPKRTRELWMEATHNPHPVAIIATGLFLSLPREDYGTYIVEKERSTQYKARSLPYTDMRSIAETLALKNGARCIYADTLLRTETIWRYKEGGFMDYYPPKFRYAHSIESHVIDMSEARLTQSNSIDGVPVISEYLDALLTHTRDKGKRAFLYCARKGLYTRTVCGDCGDPLLCEHCGYPLVLYPKDRKGEENTNNKKTRFVCHICRNERNSNTLCKNCGSWKLETLGIGIELVEDRLKSAYPNLNIFTLDGHRVKTKSDAEEIVANYYQTPGSVLLGTHMGLSYLNENVDFSAVVTLDSLLAVPDIGMSEHIFGLITEIVHKTKNIFLLQTRRADDDVLHWAIMGNITALYRREIQERERFHYPPFSILIKISVSAPKERMPKSIAHIKEMFSDYNLEIYPSFVPSPRGTPRVHALLKVPREEWPNEKIVSLLQKLPQSYSVIVEPDSLL